MIEPFRMEEDPDGTSQQVAVIMTGKVYREAGLKHSKHPEVEGLLYDKLCRIGKHKLRDDVRKIALSIALSVSDKEFKPTVAWLDDFMRRFCLSKKKMGFHSSAMLKQKGFTQPEAKSEATLQSMTQEDVFSVLGFNVDCDPSNKDKSSASVIHKNEDMENPATSGQNCDKSESSECTSLLTDSSENTSHAKIVVEKNINGTSSTDISEGNDVINANKSTLNNHVNDLSDNKVVSEIDDGCSEKGNMLEKRINEVPDTSQETLSVNVSHKDDLDDEIEEAVLDDDTKEKGAESKIGKISIKKIEDLCEKVAEKEKKNSGSNNKKSEEEASSDSSEEDESNGDEDDGTSDESVEVSDSDKNNAPVAREATRKYETENISYSKAETKFYNKNMNALQKKLEGSVIKCTSCYEQVNHHIRSLVFTHPVLGIFICKKCRKYYGRGRFCKDKEGYDEYCRLCAEGGDLLCCEQEDCYNGFCKRCVKRLLGRAELKHAESTEGWACYVCDPAPLMELRALHRLILDNLKNSEEEDAALSRNDLKNKTLQNKFKSLKQMRQLKAKKEAPKTKNIKREEEISKDSKKKSDAKIAEKEEVKKNSKQSSNKVHETEEENKPCPILRNTMDEMVEMMSKCLENIKIIESKWKKSKYASAGTDRARHHVLKQLEAMKINFDTLGKDLLECSANEVVKTKDIEKEHNEMEHSDKKLRKVRCFDDKKQDDNSTEGKNTSEDNICQEGNRTIKNDESPSQSDIFDKGEKVAGDKRIEGQGSQTEEKVDTEVAPSGEFVDHVDPYEDGSQHSSKACLPSDEEHSLPDLMDVIKDIISDHEEPMDSETTPTVIKSVDTENGTSKLSQIVRQKQKAEEKNVSNSVTPDCMDEETEMFKDKEASNHEPSRNRRRKSAADESKSDSDAGGDERTLRRTSQRIKRQKFNRDSDNDDLSENRNINKKGENRGKNKVLDGNEVVETRNIGENDEKDNDTGKSGLSASIDGHEQELLGDNIGENRKKLKLNPIDVTELKDDADFCLKKINESSQQNRGLKSNRGSDEDNNENKDLKKVGKDEVQNDILDCNKSEEVETDYLEDDKNKNSGKRNEKSRGSDVSDMEQNEGSRSDKETDMSRECEDSSKKKRDNSKDATVQKKKKGSIQNNGLSKRCKNDQKKEESSVDGNGGKHRKTRRGKQRRCSEVVEDDRFLGLVEGSETSEEENTDEEIQRRREDHTEKRRDKKKKMEKRRSSESDDVSDKKDSTSSEEKTIKVMNSKDKAESEDEKEKNECKEGMDSQEEKKEKKTEKKEDLSCKIDDGAVTKNGRDMKLGKNDSIMKEEGNIKLEDNKESLSCDHELFIKEEEKKVSKKKKVHSIKTANQMAKAAILESDSDLELEDKPKPRSKKKHIRRHLDTQNKQKTPRKLKFMLAEEEQEELKGKQLNGKCHVLVESLSSKVQKELEVHEFIYTSEFPEFEYPSVKKHGFDSDGCDADEEDSDKEFSKLMKFKSGKIKPGPKSKSLKFKPMDEETSKVSNDESEDKGLDKVSDKEAGDAANSEENENADKKHSQKLCKKKKEGLLDIDIDKDGDEENEDEELDEVKKKVKDGGISLNEKMKKHILMSSEEEVEDEEEEDQGDNPTNEKDEEERERKKYERKKEKDAKKKEEEKESSDGEHVPKVYKKGYVNLNISTDEEKEEHNEEEEEEEQEEEEEEEEEEQSAYEEDSDFEESPRKRRAFQISSSDSEDGKKRAKRAVTSEEESEEEEEKPKSKRKRIRKMTSSSDEDEDEVNKDSPSKHKKIRKVIRDEDLLETTKNATQEEEERRKRIAERQKSYNQIFLVDVESDQKDMEKLVLDFDPETKAEIVTVHEKLVKLLKPHQFKGIKFMWDASVESLERLKTSSGGGCILAHNMGLGKTLQVITFCHTLLTNRSISKEVQRILVCCPVNTIFNWVAEFKTWLKGKMLPFDVIELASAKDLWGRAYRLDDWWKEGGICIIGYSMFRNLSNAKNKRYKGKMKEIFQKTLLDPGPDFIVCDEGHMLKNEKTALSIAINKVRTQRRIVLTGTPLQNNLKEYHCMIQFVKPNLLGTKKEFMNRFVNPIEQGQCLEAMPRDVRRMKRRAHILHNLLEGCVQRFDYTVLKPFLPPKFEYVISVQLSELQSKLYQYYLDNLARGGPKRQGSGLFVDFGSLSRVWTHPKVLELAVRRAVYDEEEELDDFICDDSTTSESSDDERSRRKKKGAMKKEEETDEEENDEVEETEKPGPIPGLTESGKVRVDWWKKVVMDVAGEDFEEEEYLNKIEHGGKIILLLEILRECCSIGDKLLLFSQSLLTLDVIEEFLQAIDQGELELPLKEDSLPLPYKSWKKERDYLRLDGSTSADTRKHLCNIFNDTSNERCRLFLISTRAGGLGINLVGANRVIIFDSSWNPSHDTQSIFRIYRFGQKKPCYIYRFVAQGTMEEKIYSRQVTKMSTALRVVDEHQIKRYFKMEELAQLYEFNPSDVDIRETPIVPKDRLLAELLQKHKDWIVTYHEQDSLLENQTSEELSEEERKAAWEDYENEKQGLMVQQNRNSVMSVMGAPTMMNAPGFPSLSLSSFNFESVVNSIKSQNPNMSPMEICESVLLATKQIQKIHLNHYQRVQAMLYNLKNPMIAPEQRKLLPFGSHPEMLPLLEGQLRVLEDNIQRENQIIAHIDQGVAQQNPLLSTANLMSAGLIRGQPASTGINSATTNYVERPSTSSVGGPSHQEKKTASNDVILLD